MKKSYVLLVIIIVQLFIMGCSQNINAPQKNNSDSPNYSDSKYCEKDIDCVIVAYGGCGTTVVNAETAKNWSSEGPICEIGRYASNPRCEKFTCVADYTQG